MMIKRKAYPAIDTMLKNLAPAVRKHDVNLVVATAVEVRTYWQGGSRSSYWRCDTNGFGQQLRGQNNPEPFGKFDAEQHLHRVVDGTVIVKLGTWQGRTAVPTIYATPTMFKQLGIEEVS